MQYSGCADSKTVPDFDNWQRFVGVIEQNKISNYYEKYCMSQSAQWFQSYRLRKVLWVSGAGGYTMAQVVIQTLQL